MSRAWFLRARYIGRYQFGLHKTRIDWKVASIKNNSSAGTLKLNVESWLIPRVWRTWPCPSTWTRSPRSTRRSTSTTSSTSPSITTSTAVSTSTTPTAITIYFYVHITVVPILLSCQGAQTRQVARPVTWGRENNNEVNYTERNVINVKVPLQLCKAWKSNLWRKKHIPLVFIKVIGT